MTYYCGVQTFAGRYHVDPEPPEYCDAEVEYLDDLCPAHAEPDDDFDYGDYKQELAELRKAHEALARISDWAGRNRTGYYDEAQDDVVQIIRAAVAAANGDGA